ncbi:MAG: DUF2806 domain-containing protein [Bacteroidetes bacterium]|nr:DUF2806 domain-containing protein [Bacteroidota bacterium]
MPQLFTEHTEGKPEAWEAWLSLLTVQGRFRACWSDAKRLRLQVTNFFIKFQNTIIISNKKIEMPVEMKELAGLSEPISKLIEVVSSAIGTIYKPRAIRKEADAEAYKKEVLAKAEAKVILIEGEAKIELLERAKGRLVYQELTRQVNIEEIAEKSIKYLDEKVSEQPVDEDWRTRFFNKVQDVSSEDMQEIWAIILAGEISTPGRISSRTIEVVSNLSKLEASLFQKACSLATNKSMIWKLKNKNALEGFGLTYDGLMILRDAGLIHDSDNLVLFINVNQEIKEAPHFIGNNLYRIKNSNLPDLKKYRFNQIAFTTAGKELCSLIQVELNQIFIDKIIAERQAEGYTISKL